ncbi:MAG: STAS domain-containing protein [Ancalomicrobiaceae bacterium]|nr:STAS domain-containing protein [Ancalomicrobiaceae bacterium]
MDIRTTTDGSTFQAHMSGRLSFSDHQAFRVLMQDIEKSKAKACVFDLSQLTSVDSSGLGMFIIAAEAAKSGNWHLTLKGATGQVNQLLYLAKFDKLLTLVG